jgi:rhodanese-related sulfurtransferase
MRKARADAIGALVGILSFVLAPAVLAGPLGPEAVHDLQVDPTHAQRVEIVSIQDNVPGPREILPAERFPRDVTVVYACWSLSQRPCRDEVLRADASSRDKVFYLTGTPREWVAAKLSFPDMPQGMVEARLRMLDSISVTDLASARKDGTEFTLLDLRPNVGENSARIDGAIAVPPGLLREKMALLPKNGWIVLYDGGDHSADAAAVELRAAGFPMAVVLAGGFPAWVTAEKR